MFIDQIIPNNLYISNNSSFIRLYFTDRLEIQHFLADLESDQAYVVTFEFVYSWLQYDEDSPIINLSKPILVTKSSNPRLISNFLNERIRLACDSYYLDETVLEDYSNTNKEDKPGVILRYAKINLF
jgi:hypothetical protein